MKRTKGLKSWQVYALWPGPAEGYARKQCQQAAWRMHGGMEPADMMQEAYLVFHRVVERYSKKVDNPAWLMALYKRALANRLTDMGKRASFRTASESVGIPETVESETSIDYARDLASEVQTILVSAPDDIRSVLSVLLRCPDEMLQQVAQMSNRSVRKASRVLCVMVGAPVDESLIGRARQYIEDNL